MLAARWLKEKDASKLVVNEWKKLAGMTEINGKYRFVQFCRSLKTYGISLFTVKVIARTALCTPAKKNLRRGYVS